MKLVCDTGPSIFGISTNAPKMLVYLSEPHSGGMLFGHLQ